MVLWGKETNNLISRTGRENMEIGTTEYTMVDLITEIFQISRQRAKLHVVPTLCIIHRLG